MKPYGEPIEVLEDELIYEYLKAGDLTDECNYETFSLNVANIVQEYIELNYEFEYTKNGVIKRMV